MQNSEFRYQQNARKDNVYILFRLSYLQNFQKIIFSNIMKVYNSISEYLSLLI